MFYDKFNRLYKLGNSLYCILVYRRCQIYTSNNCKRCNNLYFNDKSLYLRKPIFNTEKAYLSIFLFFNLLYSRLNKSEKFKNQHFLIFSKLISRIGQMYHIIMVIVIYFLIISDNGKIILMCKIKLKSSYVSYSFNIINL